MDARCMIVSRGEFPHWIYFILEGTVTGIREYADGNEYSYFQLDKQNGSIGLLEILARKDRYIATIVSTTKVKLLRIEAEVIYEAIMEDKSLLRRSMSLLAEDLYQRQQERENILYQEQTGRLLYVVYHSSSFGHHFGHLGKI